MNREDRRALKKKLAPLARKIATLENQIKEGINVDKNEAEITSIIESLSLMEMMALQDYIESKGLLNNFDHNNN
jgi:hypothetical protein